MPKKGYKGITVDEATYGSLAEVAQKLQKTIPETIKFFVSIVSGQDIPQDNCTVHVVCTTEQPAQSPSTCEAVEWPEKCEPLETCERCPLKHLCWIRKFLLGENSAMSKKFVEAVRQELAMNVELT